MPHEQQERADIPAHHLADKGPAVPFPCQGAELGDLRPRTHGECFGCADWARGGAGVNRAAISTDSKGVRRCANHRPLLSGEQIAGQDEMAVHVAKSALATSSAPCLPVGGGVSATTPKGGV